MGNYEQCLLVHAFKLYTWQWDFWIKGLYALAILDNATPKRVCEFILPPVVYDNF